MTDFCHTRQVPPFKKCPTSVPSVGQEVRYPRVDLGSALTGVWNDLFNLFYDVVYETGPTSFDEAPSSAPSPDQKDENPYGDQLADGSGPI